MKKAFALIAFASCALVAVAGAEPAVAPSAPADLFSPAHRLSPPNSNPVFSAIAAALQRHGDVVASFHEERFFPFKKKPVILSGEMRLSAARGLSLHYLEPQESILIVDTRGILQVDHAGRKRPAPLDPRATPVIEGMLSALQFDLSALAARYEIFAEGDAHAWHFGFRPRPGIPSPGLSELLVDGEDAVVRRLILRESPRQRIEISLDQVRPGVAFTPDELARYFR